MRSASDTSEDAGFLDAPRVEVTVEVARGSFLKRGSTGRLDFVSPFPCPFNYGSVEAYLGLEGDLLDAPVLGPRLPRGTRVQVRALGAVGLADRGMYDDKLVCSLRPLRPWERSMVALFFRLYGSCKRVLNLWRGKHGRTAFAGWSDARSALARARPRDSAWRGPSVPF